MQLHLGLSFHIMSMDLGLDEAEMMGHDGAEGRLVRPPHHMCTKLSVVELSEGRRGA